MDTRVFWVSSLVGWLNGKPERRQTGSEHAARGSPPVTDGFNDDSVGRADMADEAGGFKVIRRRMVALRQNSARRALLLSKLAFGVFAPSYSAGNLAKPSLLPINWTVWRKSIHFFGSRFGQ